MNFLRRMPLVLVFFAITVQAKLFSNSYVSFELPPNWDCKLDVTEYICVSQYAKQAKEAIIILTAKEAGPTDQFTSYINHLKTPRNLPDKTGKIIPSKILQEPKERKISGHTWVDSMHLGSEITSYYTRYLATLKEGLAILVTFSAHKEQYAKFSSDFINAINSLRVIATKDLLSSKVSSIPSGGSEVMGVPPIETIDPNIIVPPPTSGDSGLFEKILALILLLAAIGFYLWKKRKK